jgi:hypothetical protein
MTKRHHYVILVCLLIIGVSFYLKKKAPESPPVAPAHAPQLPPSAPVAKDQGKPKINYDKVQIDGKRVVGLKPGQEKDQLDKLVINNKISDQWPVKLEQNLRLQAGQALKSFSIKKGDSFVWAQDGLALHTESVVITLKNNKNEETSFRALVDAQTGKILKSWDQPVFDPIHPKDNFKVRIDPRYHSE